MPSLLIRGIDDDLKRRLRLRAAENGRSMEEEVRQILRHTLGVPSPEEEAVSLPEDEAVPPRRPPQPQRGGRIRLFGHSSDRS
jgi:plasmid stability protein